jgi:thymidylate synthase
LLTAKEYEPPKLWVNPKITNFYDFTDEDIKLIDYKYDKRIEDIPIAI